MPARDFGDDGSHDYLDVADPGAVTSLTGYSLICLFQPTSSLRSATVAVRNAGGNAVQMIRDGGKWFYGGDFSAGYAGFSTVANHWTWAGLSHDPGSHVCRWHHLDFTAAGAPVHGDGGFAVGNPGTITTIRIGDGDNESHGAIALGAVYATDFSGEADPAAAADAFFESLFTAAAADAYNAGPLAMWLGDTDLELDITGGGADVTSTVGTVGDATDPPGFDYSLSAPPIDGVLAGTSPMPTAALLGDARIDAVLAASLPLPIAALAGDIRLDALLAGRTPMPAAALTGDVRLDAVLAGRAPMPRGTLTGDARIDGVLAGRSPMPTAHLTDEVHPARGTAGLGTRTAASAQSRTRTSPTATGRAF